MASITAVNREPKSLAWDRSPVSTATSDFVISFDDGNFFAALGGLHRSPLTTRAGSNYNNIVLLVCHRGANSFLGSSETSAEPSTVHTVRYQGLEVMEPSSGLLAVAYSLRGIRPAW